MPRLAGKTKDIEKPELIILEDKPKLAEEKRIQKMMQFEREVINKPVKPVTRLNTNYVPDEVCELLWSYQVKKDININDLCDLLNEDGYRTSTGLEFHSSNIVNTLNSTAFKKWKEKQEMGIQKSAPVMPPYKPEPVGTPGLDPYTILESLQSIVAENKKLKEENARLNKAMDAIYAMATAAKAGE